MNITQVILNLDGSEFQTGDRVCPTCGRPEHPENMTIQDAICDSLVAQFRDEQNLSGKDKLLRFRLALKVSDLDEIELTSEETTLALKVVGKMYSPLIYGRVVQVLDPTRLQEV